MNNFGLPADAAYTPDGAITFKKPASAAIQEELLMHLLELKQQLASVKQEISDLKNGLNQPTSAESTSEL